MLGDCKCHATHNRQNRGQLRFPYLIDKIEVNLDFHIFDILDFDILLGSPLEKLLASQGSLDEMLKKTASATAISCLENTMVKHFPELNPLKEMVHKSPFMSSEPILNMTQMKSFTFVKMNDHHPS